MAEPVKFDQKAVAHLEHAYSTADVVRQREAILDALALQKGESALDIGMGPGFLCREMAEKTGASGRVEGIDNSTDMIEAARRKCEGLAHVQFQEGNAARLPFPNDTFDAATIIQVYEYVPEIEKALGELRRVLRPGGRAVIIDTDWSSVLWHSSDPERTRRIITAWQEHFVHPHLPSALPGLLQGAGLRLVRAGAVPIINTAFGPEMFSHSITRYIGKWTVGRNGLAKEDTLAWAEDLKKLDEKNAYYFNINRCLFLVERPHE